MGFIEAMKDLEVSFRTGGITGAAFVEGVTKVAEDVVNPKLVSGDIWLAVDEDSKEQAFKAAYVNFYNEVRLYRLTDDCTHADMGYWKRKGYSDFRRIMVP